MGLTSDVTRLVTPPLTVFLCYTSKTYTV